MAATRHTGGSALHFTFYLVKTALRGKQDALTFDAAPAPDSGNPVASGGVYRAIQSALGDLDAVLADIVGGG